MQQPEKSGISIHPILQFALEKCTFLQALGEYVCLVLASFAAFIKRPVAWRLIQEQLYHIGVLSLPVVALTGFSTGLVLAAQSFFQLGDKGLAGTTGLMVAKSMITELGPVLTAFMITGRVGAAMCAELGTMRVTEQIDALQSMAIDPNRYLIAPRIISGIMMMPLLTIFSIVMGIFGGYLISVYFFNMAPTTYFDPMPIYISNFDFLTGVIKAITFGTLIVTISCYKGMTTKGGAQGVGRSTTNSVVVCYSCILLTNFVITLGLNLLRRQITGAPI
jgi:phospholipid/cholesterol/gamma-HCH transport system permease protein